MKKYYLLLLFSLVFVSVDSQNRLSYTHSGDEYSDVEELDYYLDEESSDNVMMKVNPSGDPMGPCPYTDKPKTCCDWWDENGRGLGGATASPLPAECPIGGGLFSMVLMSLGYAFYIGRKRKA